MMPFAMAVTQLSEGKQPYSTSGGTKSKAAQAHKARKEMLREKMQTQKAKVIATHTVASGETLSHIALKYYKHATPPYWKLLLEHNKEVLEGDEKKVRTGMELEIPELPADLKD